MAVVAIHDLLVFRIRICRHSKMFKPFDEQVCINSTIRTAVAYRFRWCPVHQRCHHPLPWKNKHWWQVTTCCIDGTHDCICSATFPTRNLCNVSRSFGCHDLPRSSLIHIPHSTRCVLRCLQNGAVNLEELIYPCLEPRAQAMDVACGFFIMERSGCRAKNPHNLSLPAILVVSLNGLFTPVLTAIS